MILVDGAQAVPHMEVDVVDLDADFYAFRAQNDGAYWHWRLVWQT